MSKTANLLLVMMAEAYDSGHENYFDDDFFPGLPNAALSDLEAAGMIERVNDIAGGFKLTNAGYKAAKN